MTKMGRRKKMIKLKIDQSLGFGLGQDPGTDRIRETEGGLDNGEQWPH